MKKLRTMIMILSVIFLSSFNNEAANADNNKLSDVVVEELETVCDCADAKAIGLKEELEAKKRGGFTDEEAKAWELKSREISSHCMGKKGYTFAQFRECESMITVKKDMDAYMKEKKAKSLK